MTVWRIGRHVSTTELVTTRQGWDNMGASPELTDRERGDFTAVLPFAGELQGVPNPPWLTGQPPRDILAHENYRRLRFAFGHDWDRLTFSVWGGIFRPDRRSPPWRVITHTFLMDGATFESISGNPEGLLSMSRVSGDRLELEPLPWMQEFCAERFEEFVMLDPLAVDTKARSVMEQDRLRRLAWMARGLTRVLGGEQILADRMSLAYEALAEVLQGRFQFVVVPERGDGTERLFVRFLWLSLPEVDRRRVTFHGDVRGPSEVRHHLSVLAAERVPRPIPQGWIVFENLPSLKVVAEGRRFYAETASGLRGRYEDMSGDPEAAGLSVLEGQEFTSWVLWLKWRARMKERPTLLGAAEGIKTEAGYGVATSEGRIAELAAAFVKAIDVDLGWADPNQAATRVLAVLAGAKDFQQLVRRVAVGLLELLKETNSMWHHRLAGLLVCRSVRDGGGPWLLGDFVELINSRSRVLARLMEKREWAEELIAAVTLAIAGGVLKVDEADEAILRALCDRMGSEISVLLAGLPSPATPNELRWYLRMLRRAAERGAATQQITRFYLEWGLPGLQEYRGEEWASVLRADPSLLRDALREATPQSVEVLLARVRPDVELIRSLFDPIRQLPTLEWVECWARSLAGAGYDPRELVGNGSSQGAQPLVWFWVFSSPAWRKSIKAESAYDRVQKFLEMEEGNAEVRVRLADAIIRARLTAGIGMLSAEVELVRTSIVLQGGGKVELGLGLKLADLARSNSEAAPSWADAFWEVGEGWDTDQGSVFRAFSRAAAHRVILKDGGGSTLREALRVAWVEQLATGEQTTFGHLIRSMKPGLHRWLLDMIEQCPPPPLYVALREAAQEAVLSPDLGREEVSALSAKALRWAPTLVLSLPLLDQTRAGGFWSRVKRLSLGRGSYILLVRRFLLRRFLHRRS